LINKIQENLMPKRTLKKTILRDLGDGLVLRRSTRADADALADFNSRIHSEEGFDKPDERVGIWAKDLLVSNHPTFGEGDYTIVEETSTGKIVSSMNLISQDWLFAEIPIKVGRPELVGTLTEFRNRGLVRQQFEVVHQWSAERGEDIQAITGIPYYYRLFGYEMALNLDGGRAGYKPQVPQLKEGQEEPYRVRAATVADVPFIKQTYDYGSRRNLVRSDLSEELIRYEVVGKSPKNINRSEFRILETPEGEAIGYFAHPGWTWGSMLPAGLYELKAGVSYGAVTPSVARYLYRTGEAYAAAANNPNFASFGFWLGSEHPVYEVFRERLPRIRRSYAWYIRVPDLPGFIRKIAPVLERRLEQSAYTGHSAEIKLTFYNGGLRMVFEKGRLATAEDFRPTPVGHTGDAAFPNLTFLQLVFGYRSLEEICYAFPDCWTDREEIRGLLEALFPKQASDLWPVA
jgi:hypothetical protein